MMRYMGKEVTELMALREYKGVKEGDTIYIDHNNYPTDLECYRIYMNISMYIVEPINIDNEPHVVKGITHCHKLGVPMSDDNVIVSCTNFSSVCTGILLFKNIYKKDLVLEGVI